jgi:2-polyprenyl-3-methyl-5-hydroxy-6-metoxy-1,4-benzoquinol methylase
MTTDRGSNDVQALSEAARAIWDKNAAWWDDKVQEGNQFQRLLIGPTTERLLDLQPGERVLDVACGNGNFSRRMASLGARVLAFDFSTQFIECARGRTTESRDRIEYQVLDAGDESALMALGERSFDAAVCSMALMDMATIDPLMCALSRLLRSGGRFVFSVLHPSFNSSDGCVMVAEQADLNGELVTLYSVKVSQYIRPSVARGLGIVGQPVSQYYFHRPLSALFSAGFAAGFAVDGLEEPIFEQPVETTRPFAWSNYREIPAVLIARMRLP